MLERVTNLKVVGISGSLRTGSCSYLALKHTMGLLANLGCETHILDLRKMMLPFCNGDSNEQWPQYPAVADLRASVHAAHAIVLASPEYHGGVSGVLKNAIDLLGATQLEGKVAGLIGVLGGSSNCHSIGDLSRIMSCCKAWVLPQHVTIAHAQQVFETGSIVNPDLLKRFERFAHSLVWSTARLCDPPPSAGSLSFSGTRFEASPALQSQ